MAKRNMKLPNNFGNINKLSGNRRNPYRARIRLDYADDGKPVFKNIGYYETYEMALTALVDYHRNPHEFENDITFAEVYERWSSSKYEKISDSNIKAYEAAFKTCSPLHNNPFKTIKLSQMQAVIDNSGKNHPTLRKIKSFLSQLFDFAVMNDIISKDKHIVEYLDIGKGTQSTKHYKFSYTEIEALWNWSVNEYVQVILMLIYTGVRPGELFSLKKANVNLTEESFNIVEGKNSNAMRKVPIHKKLLPFFEHWMEKDGEYLITQLNGKRINFDTNHGQYTETYWDAVLSEIGILYYTAENGEKKKHLPHDTRHTFTSMWKEKKLDEAYRRRIQGHSGKGIGEQVYTHLDFESLKNELNKL